jgi:hypothetical protein
MTKTLIALIAVLLSVGCGQAPQDASKPPNTVSKNVFLLRMYEVPKDDITLSNTWVATHHLVFTVPAVLYRRTGTVTENENGAVVTFGTHYCQYSNSKANPSVMHFSACADTNVRVGDRLVVAKDETIQLWVRKSTNSPDSLIEAILEAE